jgi:hypothetical protein
LLDAYDVSLNRRFLGLHCINSFNENFGSFDVNDLDRCFPRNKIADGENVETFISDASCASGT